MKKVLISGASGQLGSEVLNFVLQKKGSKNVVAMSRDLSKIEQYKAKGVELRKADYDDYDSLLKAFEGISKLYFVSGSDVLNREKQHENVVKAAVEAGVEHVVYTSFQRKDESGKSPIAMVASAHIKTEKWLKESGLNYTFMRHALYMDGIPMFIGNKVLETGTIYLPAGNGKAAFATRSDMAESGAVVLTTEGHENKSYEISGNESVSYHDVASILSTVSGKNITYVSPTPEEFSKVMADAGVPKEIIGILSGFSQSIGAGEFDIPSGDIEKLTGHKPKNLETFLKEIYSK